MRDLLPLMDLAEQHGVKVDHRAGRPRHDHPAGPDGGRACWRRWRTARSRQRGIRQAAANKQRAQTGSARLRRAVLRLRGPHRPHRGHAEAALIRKAYGDVLAGVSACRPSRGTGTPLGLPDRGAATTGSMTVVRRLLLNPRMAGLVVYQRRGARRRAGAVDRASSTSRPSRLPAPSWPTRRGGPASPVASGCTC